MSRIMDAVRLAFGRPIGKATAANPDSWFVDWVRGGSGTTSGVTVSAESATRAAAVYACVNVLADDIAKLPLVLYRRTGADGRERATSHPVYKLLHSQPNMRQTSFEMRRMLQTHLLLRGNAYALLERSGNNAVAGLIPLHSDRVKLLISKSDENALFYEITSHDGTKTFRVPESEMLHLRDGMVDGYIGKSRIESSRESIGMALAAQEYGARLFKNDAQPRGVLSHPAKLSPDAAANLRRSFEQAQRAENQHRTAVLEEGIKYTQISMSNEDAQFLETRKFQRSEIASIFRVPLHKIGDLEKSAFSNIEQQAIEYVVDGLMPHLTNWEQRFEMALLTPRERESYFIRFVVDGLLRGDTKSRFDAYAVGRMWGWLSANDVRRLEDMNAIAQDGGDDYLRPAAQVPLDEPVAESAPAPEPETPPAKARGRAKKELGNA